MLPLTTYLKRAADRHIRCTAQQTPSARTIGNGKLKVHRAIMPTINDGVVQGSLPPGAQQRCAPTRVFVCLTEVEYSTVTGSCTAGCAGAPVLDSVHG